MDKAVIREKLESLRRCVERIRVKTPATAEALMEDCDAQDIVCVNLERAVQICVDIGSVVIADSDVAAPRTMADVFDALRSMNVLSPDVADRMKKAVGFRNVAVHAYDKIDWNIVFSIAKERLGDFSRFAEEVCARLDAGS